MNERIQELITAYLHRDTTPEQERELFEACNRHPETAEFLRQQLILSLKIRSLREEVEVPTELQNDVLRRINSLEAESLAKEEQLAALPAAEPERRFGWVHLFGAGLATAACAVAIVLWSGSADLSNTNTLQPVAQLQDTVFIIEKDTVTQLREVDRPVYIVRTVTEAPNPGSSTADEAIHIAQKQEAAAPASENTIALQDGGENKPSPPVAADDRARASQKPDAALLLADNSPPESAVRESKKENYIEQYNSMLVSVETVQLSSKDRIH